MWTEPILHVDMDAFFVEVERLDDPSLRGKPVAVGGAGRRGVIASASYEARRHGVRSAQPTATALRLCPRLELVPPHHGRYQDVSRQVFQIFRTFTSKVEGLSLDEAFLDVSGLQRHHPSPLAVAAEVRSRIRADLRLPSSVGIGSSKLVAKLASETAKPDGMLYVPKDQELAFLHPLPVERLWGVGPATLAGLHRLGVETIGDLAQVPEGTLVAGFGPSHGRHLLGLAQGLDRRPVVPDSETKSISVEETYEEDLVGRSLIETALLDLAHRLEGRLRRSGLVARTVGVKVRSTDFTTVTRQVTLDDPVELAGPIHAIAVELSEKAGDMGPVRLLGLVGSGLEPRDRPVQLRLGEAGEDGSLRSALEEIRDKFGPGAVNRARAVGESGPDPRGDR